MGVSFSTGISAPGNRETAAHLQPGAKRPAFLAHQVVMAGMRTIRPMEKDPVRFGVVVFIVEYGPALLAGEISHSV